MSFDFSTLVTDRSQADVDRIRELIAKGWAAMTPEEQQAFNAASSKGSYNYTDLNRVTAAMDYINNQLVGYGYQTGYQRVEVPHQKEPVSPLPDGYTQLAWIESSGTQYVDTGVYPNQATSLEMEFAPTDLSKTEWWFGVRSSSNTNMFGFYSTSATSVYSTFASSGQTFSIPSIEGQTVSLEKGDVITTLTYGNNVEELENTDGTFTSEFALVLLSANLAGSIASSTRASGRLYSCAIYDGSSLIRNFVPCLNPSNEVGLYDTVNEQFYGNSGTGEFVAGPVPVRLPDGYTQLEYIESSGTQYINTLFKPNQDTRVVVDLKILESQTSQGHICSVAESSFYTLLFNPNDTMWYQTRYGSGNVLRFPTSCNTRDRITIDKNKNVTTIGAESVTHNTFTFQLENTLPLLCRKNTDGSLDFYLSARLYSCKIYDNGTLIRDYVPAGNSSGVVGLYDVVNNEFYQNAGTGVFTAGPEVEAEPEEEEELDPYTWYESDIPTESLMTAYLSNVEAIRSVLEVLSTTPETPESMEALTWVEANNIEQILVDVETVINRVVNGMARSNSFTFWSGNRPFPTAESNLGRNWAELDAMNTGWENWQVATWYLLLYGNLEAEGVVS